MENKTKVVSIVLFLSVFMMFVSCGKQEAEWKGTIDVENGITVVKNPKEPMYEEDVFRLEEELSIGKAEGKEEFMFSLISGIAVDENERIYVLDYKEAHVKIFDKNGYYIKTVSRRGQGPGEMSAPFSICITNQNEIMVQDLNNHRIIFFSLNGNFIRSLSTAKIIIVGSYIDSNGNIIGIVSTRGPERQVIELKKFSPNLDYLFSLCSFSLPSSSSSFNPFGSELRWAVGQEDNIICGYSKVYELNVYNSEGKLMKKITKEFDPVRITQNEIDDIKKIPIPMKLDIPSYHSAYQDLTVDEKNRIFVMTWEKTKDGKGYYHDVYDSEGRYTVKIPLKMKPLIWKKNKLYTVEEDEKGFQMVKRYKVTWKY